MAGKIKGITIEIGGDTQPLQKALRGVTKESQEASKELKAIDKALKFDTGNVTLLSQKQEVLQKQVTATKEKLEILRQAQAQVERQFQNGEIGADQYRAFKRELEVTQNVLKTYEGQLASVTKAMTSHGDSTQTAKNKLSGLQEEQKRLASESEKLVSSFKLQESQLGKNASESERLALAEKKVASQSDLLERQIKNLDQQLDLTKQAYGENSVEANKLEKTLNETKAAYQNLQGEMQELGQASSSAKTGLAETNDLLKADLLLEFSDRLGELSQKLIDFGQNSLEAFRQVDEGMDIIVTKTGATGQALEEMTGIASTIATTLPTSFEVAGQAVGEVNTQFGLMGDSLQMTAEDLIKFSEINGSDVTQSTIQSKQALEAYGLSVDWLSDVLDSVTYVAQATGVSVQDLMTKAIDGAPQIKALGLEFGEGVTLIGQFEQAGVDSSAALSSLSKAAVAYAKDGKNLEEGLRGTIAQIQSSTSETESLTIASEIFGAKAAPRMVDAIKRGTFSFEQLSETAKNSAGVVSQTYEATLDPIDRFTVAQNLALEAMAEIGGIIAEVLAPVFELLASLLRDVVTWFAGLSPPIKTAVVIIGSIVAVIGTLLPIILGVVVGVQTLLPLLSGLAASFAPIIAPVLGVVAAIVALIAIFVTLWKTNEEFRDGVMLAWQVISDTISQVITAISSVIMAIWGQLVTWWQDNQALIQESVQVVWGAIQTIIETVMTVLGPFLEAAWSNIQLVISTAWEVIKTIVETAITVVLGIIKAVMQVITGDWSGAWETIKGIFETVWLAIQTIVQTILSAISQYISTTWSAIQASMSAVMSIISNLVSNAWQGISSTISGILSGISGTVSSIWEGIRTSISNAINGAKDAVSSAINAIKNLFNFKFQWPHIPLPHFSISGSANPLDWLKGGLPSISVAWYAKGGILTKPTAFGMNGNQLMVGGEAGREAVLPLNRSTLGEIGRGIAETMGQAPITVSVTISDIVVREEADIVRLADEVARRLSQALEREKGLRGGYA